MVGAEALPAAARPEPEPIGARVAAAGRRARTELLENPQPADELAEQGDVAVTGKSRGAPSAGGSGSNLPAPEGRECKEVPLTGPAAGRPEPKPAGAKGGQ